MRSRLQESGCLLQRPPSLNYRPTTSRGSKRNVLAALTDSFPPMQQDLRQGGPCPLRLEEVAWPHFS
jgi:hypothetical protein